MTKKVKVLTNSTIISDDLYVTRAADRQLHSIIEEMGRPGYILVARQMGKTNLLLRMKREREQQGELVLFVDLSTHYKTARHLFRAIIDNLTEKIGLEELAGLINDSRKQKLDPSTEYDRHLRLLLSHAKYERVIIMLDEIDSLVGHAYSDRILSQIRSLYFARVNHPDYERLTYVLSGVAEPSDLIKDKNVSPFNIGEKIYLEDFSLSEVSQFLRKANIDFSEKIILKIYEWAGGNPRMTWDICSALEDMQIYGEVVDTASVDAVVQKLYFERFDRAPIDHIRYLAANNEKVRAALIALLDGKYQKLDDTARSKLYLAGITTPSGNEIPKIKNKIIADALSESWLMQVEAEQLGLLETAIKRYQDKDFSGAVLLYEKFITQSGSLESVPEYTLMHLGLAHFNEQRFDDAATLLLLAQDRSNTRDLDDIVRFYLATIKILTGEAVEAIPDLIQISSSESEFKLRALQALGSAYISISIDENSAEIIARSLELLEALESDQFNREGQADDLRAVAHLNLGQTYYEIGDKQRAFDSFEAAVYASSRENIAAFAAIFLSHVDTDERKLKVLNKAASITIEEQTQYFKKVGSLDFTVAHMAILTGVALQLGKFDLFEGLLDLASKQSEGNRFHTLLVLAQSIINTPNAIEASILLKFALEDKTALAASSQDLRFAASRNLATFWGNDDTSYLDMYFDQLFSLANDECLTGSDLLIIISKLNNVVKLNDRTEARKLIKFVRDNSDRFKAISPMLFSVFIHSEMVFYNSVLERSHQLRTAREILQLTGQNNIDNDEYSGAISHLLPTLRQNAQQAILQNTSINYPKKTGRNHYIMVRDPISGVVSRSKFKVVKDRLERGELEFVGLDTNDK
tara:strand:- start:687 stop:3281 length:2595 start_codon:yes stop_codon:yes gene_type:complete